MNNLSKRDALRCETANELKCKCRCGGAKHGAGRVTSGDGLYSLPMGDPHRLVTAEEKREAKRKERDEIARKRAEARASVFIANLRD